MSASLANDSRARPYVLGSSTTDMTAPHARAAASRAASLLARVRLHRRPRASATTSPITIVAGAVAVDLDAVRRQLVERAAPHLLVAAARRRRRSPPACRAPSRDRSAGRRSPRAGRGPSARRGDAVRLELRRSPTRTPRSSWPLTTRNADATPRCVTGMPAAAGAATALVTPGTTSYGTPARCSASASSPPRPNTNGSPPFSRTTRRPRRAARIISAWIAVLRHRVAAGALADEEPLRPPRERRMRSSTSASYSTRSARAQPRDRRARQQPGIAGSGADERDMSSYSHESSGPLSQANALGPRLSPSSCPRRDHPFGRALQPRWRHTARSARAAAAACARPSARRRAASRPRSRRACSTHAPRSRGSTASSAFAQQRGQRRRLAAGRNRQRHAVAPDHAAQERAGVRRIVDGVDEQPPLLGGLGHLAIDLGRRGRDDQPRAVEVRRDEPARHDCRRAALLLESTSTVAGEMSGATMRTRAPAASSCRSFAAATRPPPTSTTARPVRLRNSGNSSIVFCRLSCA